MQKPTKAEEWHGDVISGNSVPVCETHCGIMRPLKRTLAHSQFLFQSHTEKNISQRE
jgi:hypothetical protein